MKIKIITDSTSDLPQEYAKAHGISVLPIGIEIDGVSYSEGVDITAKDFYAKLKEAKKLPHTSQINSYTFTEEIEKHAGKGCFFCILTISKELSNTYSQALIAAKEFANEDIYLCDTMTTSVGLAMLTNYALSLSETEGIDRQTFITKLEKFKERIKIFGVISDLKYLKMGGRLSSGAAFIGSMLKITPLVTVDGKVKVVEKFMGHKRAYAKLAQILAERDMAYPMYIGHSDCYDFMKSMLEAQRQTIKPDSKEKLFNIGAAIGTHVGPGTVAIAFVEKEQSL